MAETKIPVDPEVAQLSALLHDQPVNPMRPNVREYHEEELRRMKEIVQAPAYVQANRGFAGEKSRRIQKMLDDQAPKKIGEPIRQDAVAKLADAVLNHVIRPAMLTHEEMRRSPVGAVDGFLRRENAPPIKRAVQVWKRAMWALEPENLNIDYTNMERFRSSGMVQNGAATFAANAQIPGNFAQTPISKINWPLGEPTADTALKQIRRKEAASIAAKARWVKRNAKLAKLAAAKVARKSSLTQPVAVEAAAVSEG